MLVKRGRGRPKKVVGEVDRATLAVLVVYTTQIEGRPTTAEIHETIVKKIGMSQVTSKQVQDTAESCRKKGLLSINYDTDSKGQTINRYSVRDVKFSKPPEIAHIKAVLPELLKTPEAIQIQGELEGIHEAGEKKGRLPDIRDYAHLCVTWKIVTPLLGGQPSGEKDLQLHRRAGKDTVWLPLNLWLRGALRLPLRMKNVSESKVQYISAKDQFTPISKLEMDVVTVPTEFGLSKHEAILPGQEISTQISVPTTGFMTKTDFKKCLDGIRVGAKHKEFGLLHLVDVQEA